ncbi:MAG: GNAT family N-acetyltransferase [Chromatiales bacterium]|nr:GNAT family N-acetyltransferase [Chromatiales bacterium]
MNTTSDYQISTASRAEVDIAVDWAAAEGWNPGLGDAEAYYRADPSGFLIGRLHGEPVATISAVRYGDFGFMGFYIVRPAERGRGLGIAIWNAALRHLEGCTVGLDGVVAQQDNYRKSGFALAFNNARYEGQAEADLAPDPNVIELSTLPVGAVMEYDRAFFPAERRAFLRHWITQPGAVALGLRAGDSLAGYGVIRPCRTGSKIGPLYADRPGGADALFRALAARVPAGSAIYLDVPEVNRAAVSLAESHGMRPVFQTARMYAGAEPPLPRERMFGITSFEVG